MLYFSIYLNVVFPPANPAPAANSAGATVATSARARPSTATKRPPKSDTQSSKAIFCRLPIDDNECARVDVEKGLYYICAIPGCPGSKNRVNVRFDRPFTLVRWNEHKKSKKHLEAKRKMESLKAATLKKKKEGGTKLTRIEKGIIKMVS